MDFEVRYILFHYEHLIGALLTMKIVVELDTLT